MRPSGKPAILENRRRQAMELLREGLRPVDVAHRLGVDRRSVRRWKAAFRVQGEHGLRARPNPGRPPRLNERHRQRLERLLIKGARACGFPTDLWTCPRIAVVIQKHFSVRYHVDYISLLMHSLGWSPQKLERRSVERDEKRIRTWVKVDWIRIKKNLSPECLPGVY